ncbi:hypothetical protein [Chitinophaga rhizosphaerae]|uniref:hypothetical protein n=1 Tax=Chitinophaga rhizosphaerae TaxID=1864947 RepID=UPI000F80C784|nr:hypothetical protein [Chitinophaga rhizosphaerae]
MRLLIGCAGAWACIHFFRGVGHPLPFLNGYLTDFLAIPAMAHLALLIIRRSVARDPGFVFPFGWVLFVAAYVSLVMEALAPAFSPRYTGDWGDVAAYFAGGFCYQLWMKRKTVVAGNKREPV